MHFAYESEIESELAERQRQQAEVSAGRGQWLYTLGTEEPEFISTVPAEPEPQHAFDEWERLRQLEYEEEHEQEIERQPPFGMRFIASMRSKFWNAFQIPARHTGRDPPG